jgi:hypothetical protein
VLVLFPADSITAAGSTLLGTAEARAAAEWVSGPAAAGRYVEQKEWNVWSGTPGREYALRRGVTVLYDGFTRKAVLAGQRYSLDNGNLFVVRFDASGRPTVQQLPHTLRSSDEVRIVRTFQALLPNDAAVQDLTHFAVPCPRRTTSPPAQGAST